MTPEKSAKVTNWILAGVLLAGFVLQIYLIYFGYKAYNYQVPPGSDAIAHYGIIQKIIETGQISFINYPPGFHLLVIFLAKIFHQGTFYILTYWTPMLVVLPALSMYFLLRQLFENKVSVITTLIFLLTSYYPMVNFMDGNYPDILAYGVFAILMFAFLIRYLNHKKIINLAYASILFLAIAVVHHFSFVNILAILVIFSLFPLYSFIFERKMVVKFGWWQFIIGFIVAGIIGTGLYFAVKFYGPLIMKFADGFISNKSALSNNYLNTALDYPEYISVTGPVVWYFGLIGLFYMFISSFKAGPQARVKQLVVIWVIYFFLMSRFGASALPARFAREIAPALIVAIGFLLNYMVNLNSLRFKGYKIAIGFGLLGFVLVTNSFLMTGPARIPESFSNMIWFWPKDQAKIDYINERTSYEVLYNPYANLYMPIKAPANFKSLSLTNDELKIVKETKIEHYSYVYISSKKAKTLKGYEKLIYDLRQQNAQVKYILLDVKPPSNPDPKVYPKYAEFEAFNKVLDDLADSGTVVKKFDDGSRLVKMY